MKKNKASLQVDQLKHLLNLQCQRKKDRRHVKWRENNTENVTSPYVLMVHPHSFVRHISEETEQE